MRVENHASLAPDELSQIESEIGEPHNLNDVMRWARAQSSETFIPGIVAEVVTQDEFTHDVIIPWRNSLTLVYGVT